MTRFVSEAKVEVFPPVVSFPVRVLFVDLYRFFKVGIVVTLSQSWRRRLLRANDLAVGAIFLIFLRTISITQ